jgi:hypothetical protein
MLGPKSLALENNRTPLWMSISELHLRYLISLSPFSISSPKLYELFSASCDLRIPQNALGRVSLETAVNRQPICSVQVLHAASTHAYLHQYTELQLLGQSRFTFLPEQHQGVNSHLQLLQLKNSYLIMAFSLQQKFSQLAIVNKNSHKNPSLIWNQGMVTCLRSQRGNVPRKPAVRSLRFPCQSETTNLGQCKGLMDIAMCIHIGTDWAVCWHDQHVTSSCN